MNAINVLCAQLTRDLFSIAKFLFRHTLELSVYKDFWHTYY